MEDKQIYQKIFEQAEDGIILMDCQGIITSCNPKAINILGYQLESLLGKPFVELVHSKSIADRSSYLENLWQGNTPFFEQELICKDGSKLIAELSLSRLDYGDYLAILRNITKRKRRERALQGDRDNILNIFDSIADGVCVVDEDFEIQYVNHPLVAEFGPPEGRKCYTYFHDRKDACPWCRNQETFEGKTTRWQWTSSKNGKTYDLIDTPFIGNDGRTCKLEIFRDITELKKMEQSLRQSEQFKQRILNNLFVFVGVLTPDGTLIDANEASLRAAGITLDDVCGRKFWQTYWWSYDDTVQSQLQEACERAANGEAIRYDVYVRMAHNALMPIDFQIAPLRNEKGEITHLIPSAVNITDRKQAEQDLREAKKKADSANKSKSEFLANISHEIRTPLNGVKGMIELANRRSSQDEVKEYLELAKQSADHLMCIINDVIDLSKIEAGHTKLNKQPFSLSEVLEATFYPLRIAAANKGLGFEVEVGSDVPDDLLGDQSRFRQILENIVGNAVKFTHSGEVSVALSLSEDLEDRVRLQCQVRDTGIGIPPEDAETIFDNFGQSNPAIQAKYGGSGLGLALCKHYLQMMEGEIWCSSTEGQGSTFTFTLVFDKYREVRADLPSEEAGSPQSTLGVRALKILVADDSKMNQIFTEEILKDKGHEVVIAEDGQQALRALAMERFDLVIMDIRMPKLDGQEALRAIRGQSVPGVDPRIPVIALTAYALKEERESLLSQGFDGYLSKPIDIEAFEKLISDMECKKGSQDTSFQV